MERNLKRKKYENYQSYEMEWLSVCLSLSFYKERKEKEK